jgi:RNA polymerase sigma factor (sigma-70 family)
MGIKCGGPGSCHGCLSWCAWCGSVGQSCDFDGCDQHRQCDVPGCTLVGYLGRCHEHFNYDPEEIARSVMEPWMNSEEISDAVVKNGGRVRAVLGRYASLSEADHDDLFQDTMLTLVTQSGSFQGKSKLATWLYRVASNHARMLLWSQRHRVEVLCDEVADVESDGSWGMPPEEALIAAQRRAEVEALFARVMEAAGEDGPTLAEAYADEVSQEAMAAARGLKKGGMRKRLSIIRKRVVATVPSEI